MGERLRISLFGQPRFVVDGEAFKFGALPRSLALLGYLIVRRHVAIPRETLAFALWPDDSEDEALGKLRRHVYDVTRSLPRTDVPWILADRECVQWNGAAPSWLDVEAFEREGADAKTRAAAVDLYAGDLLESLLDEWVLVERERLRGLMLRYLGELVDTTAATREYDRSIGYANRYLQLEPWREDVLRELMLLRYQSGDRAGALYCFDDFARRLEADLGTPPMPETLAVREAILANREVTLSREIAREPAPAELQTSGEILAGRKREFEALQVAWQRAARGHGNTTFVHGPSGVGKSQLLDALARLVRRQGGRVLFARAPVMEDAPYEVLRQALSDAQTYVGEAAAGKRAAGAERFADAIRTIARSRPTLLVLAGIDRCSETTIALLEYLVRSVTQASALMVLTSRGTQGDPPFLEATRRELIAQGFASDIPLAPLDVSVMMRAAAASPMLGRDAEVREVVGLLQRSRVVTIAGSPGIGKTRLGLAVALEVASEFAGGVRFVDLAYVEDPARAIETVATSLGLEAQQDPAETLQGVVDRLHSHAMLLVLDNCEHLLAEVRAVAAMMNESSSRLLCTSREPLGVDGEEIHRVSPLAPSDALALFVARARAVQPGFAVTAANQGAIEEIIARLDGIPLAVELAAARVRVMSAESIARHLDERFALLAGTGNSDVRRRALHEAIDWSYALLDEDVRSVFRRLAVLRGTWTVDAAAAICAEPGAQKWQTLDRIAALVDKSLLVSDDVEGERRFHFLESIREFAVLKLAETGDAEAAARRHAAYFSDRARRLYEKQWDVNLHEWMGLVRADLPNFRTAVDWGLSAGNATEAGSLIVAHLFGYWFYARAEGGALVRMAHERLDGETSLLTRAKVLLAVGHSLEYSGNQEKATQDALELFKACDDRLGELLAMGRCAYALLAAGRSEEARQLWREEETLARAAGRTRIVAGTLSMIGLASASLDELTPAREQLEEAVTLYRAFGDDFRTLVPLGTLAEVAAYDGDFHAAIEAATAVLEIAQRSGDERALCNLEANIAAYYLELDDSQTAWSHAQIALARAGRRKEEMVVAVATIHLAHIAAIGGNERSAAQLLGYADAIYRRLGTQRERTERRSFDRALERVRAALDASRIEQLLATGAALDWATAIALAQSVLSPSAKQQKPETT